MTRRLFGTNGIRGVANEEITPEFSVRIGQAIGTFFGLGSKILVGMDGRTSSPMIKAAVEAGLASAGVKVFDAEMLPTPALQYAVKHLGMDGGVMITASHNPPEFNGIKVVYSDGVELDRSQEEEVERIFFEQSFEQAPWHKLLDPRKVSGILDLYVEAVKSHVDVEAIRKRGYTVVVDPGNGVGALTTPKLLKELGCRVVAINSAIDGSFPGRLPEPTPENLSLLSETVKAVGADLGVAHDGDADRAIFTDEFGEVHWGDETGILVMEHLLRQGKGDVVVTPVSSSHIVEDIARKYGARVVWTKVGSIVVSRTMLKEGAIYSYEENGGIFYKPHQPVRDGAMAVALVLDIMASTGKTLSQLLREQPKVFLVKKRVECPNELKEKVLEELMKATEGMKRITIDGVKVLFDDGAVLIRPSGTEPIYRCFCEGYTEERARELAEWGVNLISEAVKKVSSS